MDAWINRDRDGANLQQQGLSFTWLLQFRWSGHWLYFTLFRSQQFHSGHPALLLRHLSCTVGSLFLPVSPGNEEKAVAWWAESDWGTPLPSPAALWWSPAAHGKTKICSGWGAAKSALFAHKIHWHVINRKLWKHAKTVANRYSPMVTPWEPQPQQTKPATVKPTHCRGFSDIAGSQSESEP